MSLSSISLGFGIIGAALGLANQLERWLEKRRQGTVDEHRLDLEGLRTLVAELRTELDRTRSELAAERDARALDRARISELEGKVATLTKSLRIAQDAFDSLQVQREMKR